jgi:hypothetical protein
MKAEGAWNRPAAMQADEAVSRRQPAVAPKLTLTESLRARSLDQSRRSGKANRCGGTA